MKREIECEVVNLMQQAKKTHRYRICNDLDFFREVSVSNFSRIPHYSDCGGGGFVVPRILFKTVSADCLQTDYDHLHT